ncbi:MAG: pyridoxine 5'-phosphate synthase [Cellvibrionaceae bacterium]
MTALSVNLNKIALLRNSREGTYPSVTEFGNLALEMGADGLTVHPRPDQRHIRVDDVIALSIQIKEFNQVNALHKEFNIEGNPFAEAKLASSETMTAYPGLMSLIDQTRPDQATLVPDNNTQLTSDHGFDLRQDGDKLLPIVEQLKQWKVRCSLFMDADCHQISLAKELGVERIELYTGPYALASKHSSIEQEKSLAQYKEACNHALDIGLAVNAGHDLNLNNLKQFLAIGDIAEVSIGHALTVDALLLGYKNAIVDYSRICHFE